MSRNGSGTYNLPAGNPVVTGTTITSTWANTTLSDIAGALTGSVASDGQTPMSANLNLATNKIINVGDPTNAQDAATKSYTDAADALSLLKANNLSDVANATTSRTNISAAKSGANSDITSLSGLTTALSAAQGGTGLTSPGTNGNVLTSDGTNWASTAPVPPYAGPNSQTFTSSGTFTIPSGITRVKVTVCGGGGGGGQAYNGGVAQSGGTSSFGSYVSATGGAGGQAGNQQGSQSGWPQSPGVGTTGVWLYPGSYGFGALTNGSQWAGGGGGAGSGNASSNWIQYYVPGNTSSNAAQQPYCWNIGLAGIFGGSGGSGARNTGTAYAVATGYGNGGGGTTNGGGYQGAGGSGGGVAVGYATGLTPGNTVSVTVGSGGTGGGGTGSNGTAGIVIVEW